MLLWSDSACRRPVSCFSLLPPWAVGGSRGFVQSAGDGKGTVCINGVRYSAARAEFAPAYQLLSVDNLVVGIIIRINARADRGQVIRIAEVSRIQRCRRQNR